MSVLDQTPNDLQAARLVLNNLTQSVESIQSHLFAIVTLSDQWRTFQTSFSTAQTSITTRIDEIESKERQLDSDLNSSENRRKELDLRDRRLVSAKMELNDRRRAVEMREREVRDCFEVLELEKERVEERRRAVELMEKRLEEREGSVQERFDAVELMEKRFVKLEEREERVRERLSAVESKEERLREVKEREVRVRERWRAVESMEERLREVEERENAVKERWRAVEAKEVRFSELDERERRVEERSKAVELEEKRLDERRGVLVLREKEIDEGYRALEVRGKRWSEGVKEKQWNERSEVLALRAKRNAELCELLESREKEIGEERRALEVREKRWSEGVKEKRLNERNEVLALRAKRIAERCAVLELREKDTVEGCKALEVREKRLSEGCKKLDFEKMQLDMRSKLLELKDIDKRCRALESREKRLSEGCEELSLKEKRLNERNEEMELKAKRIAEHFEVLESREKEIGEGYKALEFREKHLNECCEKLEVKEKGLDVRLREVELKESRMDEHSQAVDLKEKLIDEHCSAMELREVEMDARSVELERREKEIDERCKELELKEKQGIEQSQLMKSEKKRMSKKREELDLKEKQLNESSKALELKEKNISEGCLSLELKTRENNERCERLVSREKEIAERCQALELKEKEIAIRFQALELEQKELDEHCGGLGLKEKELGELSQESELKEKKIDEANERCDSLCLKDKQLSSARSRNAMEKTETHVDFGVDDGIESASLRFWVTMDGKTLQSFLNERVSEHESMGEEVGSALKLSSNPPKLVLAALDGFFPPHLKKGNVAFEANAVRSSCVLLLEQLMYMEPAISEAVKRDAKKMASLWREKMREDGESHIVVLGFLLLVVTYQLMSHYEKDDLKGLYVIINWHRVAHKLRVKLGLVEESESGGGNIFQQAEQLNMHSQELSLKGKLINEHFRPLELRTDETRECCQQVELEETQISLQCMKLDGEKEICRHCKEHDLREKQLNDRLEGLELKEKQIDECLQQLGLKDKRMCEPCPELEIKEQQVDDHMKHFEFEEKQLNDQSKILELKEKRIDESTKELEMKEKEIHDRCEKFESREKEIGEHCLALDLKEKHIDEPFGDLESRKKWVIKGCQTKDFIEKNTTEHLQVLDTKKDEATEHDKALEVEEEKQLSDTNSLVIKSAPKANLGVDEIESEDVKLSASMDGKTLQMFLNERVLHHDSMGEEVKNVLKLSVNPPGLVLAALDGFFPPHFHYGNKPHEVSFARSSCVLLLEQLMYIEPKISKTLSKKARTVANLWRERKRLEKDNQIVVLGFLLLVVTYRLVPQFQRGELMRLYETLSGHRLAPELRLRLRLVQETEGILHVIEPVLSSTINPSSEIQSFCSSMDADGLRSYMLEHVMEHDLFREKIIGALRFAPDPAALVFSVVRSFNQPESSTVNKATCIFLLELLTKLQNQQFSSNAFCRVQQSLNQPSLFKPELNFEAKCFASVWKRQLVKEATQHIDVYGFLQFIAAYKLAREYDEGELFKLFQRLYDGHVVYRPEENPYLCRELGLVKKIPGLIKQLISKNKEFHAIKYIHAFMQECHFPLVPLLKKHVKLTQDRAVKIRVNGKNTVDAKLKAIHIELAHIGAVVQHIKDWGLESEYSPADLESRIKQLKTFRAELQAVHAEADVETNTAIELPVANIEEITATHSNGSANFKRKNQKNSHSPTAEDSSEQLRQQEKRPKVEIQRPLTAMRSVTMNTPHQSLLLRPQLGPYANGPVAHGRPDGLGNAVISYRPLASAIGPVYLFPSAVGSTSHFSVPRSSYGLAPLQLGNHQFGAPGIYRGSHPAPGGNQAQNKR